jgi:glycine/D-amino acid oxidase-like deaminating enzyme
VIIGGGITGASIAFQLAQQSSRSSSVLLLDRGLVGSGNTSKSAGLVLHSHKTRLARWMADSTTADVERFLQQGHEFGYSRAGSLAVVGDGSSAQNPSDYAVDASNLAATYLARTRDYSRSSHGKDFDFTVREDAPVTMVEHSPDEGCFHIQVEGCEGTVRARAVFNAGGAWCNDLRGAGDVLPVVNLRSHYYEFAAPPAARGCQRALEPTVLLPGLYLKRQPHKLEVGVQEQNSMVVPDPDGVPPDYTDADIAGLFARSRCIERYVPEFRELQLRSYIAGLSTYTADGLPVIAVDDRLSDVEVGQADGVAAAAEERLLPGRMSGQPAVRCRTNRMVTVAGCNGYGVTWAGGLARLAVQGMYPCPRLAAAAAAAAAATVAAAATPGPAGGAEASEPFDLARAVRALCGRRFAGLSATQVQERALNIRHSKLAKQ